jgi:hypothetical protein
VKPICVKCRRFYRPKRNGVFFIEGMPPYAGETQWRPYKLWQGDLWECLGCGHELISGVGHFPIREHYQDDFDEVVRILKPGLQVDDC